MFPFKMDNDLFQPTPSSRRVTTCSSEAPNAFAISTNTLLTEGDDKYQSIYDLILISTNTLLTEGDAPMRSCRWNV